MRGLGVAVVAATVMCGLLGLPGVASAATSGSPVIDVLSVRADLVSGGEALTSITLPRGSDPSTLATYLDGHRVKGEFALRANGLFEGLLTGLRLGRNTLTAVLPDGHGASITITDHPLSGPVFSGPQAEPWTCEAGATDADCDKAPVYSYLYEKPGTHTLVPYDRGDPPRRVATTTTDAGVKVPFIVREEIAYEDRDQVRIETLYEPGKSWTPWSPQAQWNHKVYVLHGADCHDTHGVTTAPWGDTGGAKIEASSTEALGMGFVVMSTALDNAAADCNPALEAESVLMAKEHITDQLGTIADTIGYGCSGGSLAEQWMANAYPGLYQGLIAQCAFPDAGSAAQQIVDYEALDSYFASADATDPTAWSLPQESEVDGTAIWNVPGNPTDAALTALGFFPFAIPTNCTDYASNHSYVPAAKIYNASTNPGGVRCGLTDWNINLLGVQPKSDWDAQEQTLGHGFANVPLDSVGIEYGLQALEQGEITPAQFTDLNANIGAFDEDWQHTATRARTDEAGLANAYRSGFIDEANNLSGTAILDLMGPNDPGLAHDTVREFELADRLKRDFGTSANLVMWQGPKSLIGAADFDDKALKAMDKWLEAIAADHSKRALARKVLADKPASIHNACANAAGTFVSDKLCPRSVVPVYSTPRMVAGEPQTGDQNACQLEPLSQSSFAAYGISFTTAEWSTLEGAFPDGVCDWSKPGIGQQKTIAWQTYQSASGKVIYGGRAMGAAPASSACVVRRAARPAACTKV